jgi:diaminopimelate decarboxylase
LYGRDEFLDPFKTVENKNGELFIGGVSAIKLATKFDTPLYVINEERIRENYRNLLDALHRNYRKVRIYYSAKANTNIAVLAILKKEGAYLDAVSVGEVFLALKAGFPPEKILFTGTNVRSDEIRYLLKSEVTINIDSISQLDRLLKISTPQLLSVRINPEIGAGHHDHCITAGKNSKFGIWEKDAFKAYERAWKAGVKKFGIHMHIGSGILTIDPFVSAAEKLLEVAGKIHNKIGIEFDFINFGGGLGVPYTLNEEELNINEYSDRLVSLFKTGINRFKLGDPVFCIEPGRYIVCDAGILLTRVTAVKVTPFKKFVGVDAGFNLLIRPAMYGSYHHILVANRLNDKDEELYDIAGPLCESGDIFARDRKLPKIMEGDLLAILNTGAYGFCMSSQYNSKPRCSEVLVNKGKYALIREREVLDDLLRGQRIPSWLR